MRYEHRLVDCSNSLTADRHSELCCLHCSVALKLKRNVTNILLDNVMNGSECFSTHSVHVL